MSPTPIFDELFAEADDETRRLVLDSFDREADA